MLGASDRGADARGRARGRGRGRRPARRHDQAPRPGPARSLRGPAAATCTSSSSWSPRSSSMPSSASWPSGSRPRSAPSNAPQARARGPLRARPPGVPLTCRGVGPDDPPRGPLLPGARRAGPRRARRARARRRRGGARRGLRRVRDLRPARGAARAARDRGRRRRRAGRDRDDRDPRRLGRPLARLPRAGLDRRAGSSSGPPGRTRRGARGEAEIDIVIDPGRAFGTGAHATTALSLELLLRARRPRTPERGAVADLGTGSGVLAIAAAKLGFGPVLGCDHELAGGRGGGRERRARTASRSRSSGSTCASSRGPAAPHRGSRT